jgi:hypothetical protein
MILQEIIKLFRIMKYIILSGKLKQSVYCFQVKYKKCILLYLSHSYCVSNHRDRNKLSLKHNLIGKNIILYICDWNILYLFLKVRTLKKILFISSYKNSQIVKNINYLFINLPLTSNSFILFLCSNNSEN